MHSVQKTWAQGRALGLVRVSLQIGQMRDDMVMILVFLVGCSGFWLRWKGPAATHKYCQSVLGLRGMIAFGSCRSTLSRQREKDIA